MSGARHNVFEHPPTVIKGLEKDRRCEAVSSIVQELREEFFKVRFEMRGIQCIPYYVIRVSR